MKFPKLVIDEAKALREHATEEEKSRLKLELFNAEDDNRCIYGLMTGKCFTSRAKELIEKSCQKVYKRETIPHYTRPSHLNGSPVGMSRFDYWSPIEVFIASRKDGQAEANKKLIQFIKGEIKTLS